MSPLLAACLLLAPVSHTASDVCAPEAVRPRVEAAVADFLAQPGAVGLSVAVGIGQEVVLAEGYGMAELEHGAPADADTMFRIGSITKQFTAAAILRLQDHGKLLVDEDVHAYLPDLDTKGREVTLRHLLTHTSGIKSYTSLGEAWLRVTPLELTHEELLALIADEPLDFEPGTRFSYDNTGYYLLGMVIEAVAGVPYGDFLESELFEPLGLERIRYDSNSDLIPNRAQGYRLIDGKLANDAPIGMSQPGGAGGLISSAEDLVRWQIALVNGKVVSPADYEEMTTPYMLADGTETTYGFGLALGELDGHPVVGHGGGIFGFNSSLQYLSDVELSVAVISNSEDASSEALGSRILVALLAGG